MQLSEQVCSLGLAKKLKELGVKQKSYFHWVENTDGEIAITNTGRPIWLLPDEHFGEALKLDDTAQLYSAFTVADLGALLPAIVTDDETGFHYVLKQEIHDAEWILDENGEPNKLYKPRHYALHYESRRSELVFHHFYTMEENEANSRAKMLVWLIENNYIKVGGIK